MNAVLYIVATPIGNLEDFSQRGRRVLSEVDLILCEDTRVTKKLLERYQIKTPTLSYHQHSKLRKLDYILGLLKKGKKLALVSDSGTPGLSDPGEKLIAEALKLTIVPPLKITAVPGASALTAAASIAGFPMDKFLFLGFPPVKKRRKNFFCQIVTSEYPVIFYESSYRILKTLQELHKLYYHSHGHYITIPKVVVCRELTKKFETIYRGTFDEVLEELQKSEIKGEFVVIVKN